MTGKDIQNQGGPVQNLYIQTFLQFTLLAGAEFIVKQKEINIQLVMVTLQFFNFAAADQRAGIDAIQALIGAALNLETGRIGQSS
jgi:hypothetical protein